MRTLIINFKNYGRILGAGSVELARAAARASSGLDVDIIVAPPAPTLAMVASKVDIKVFAQAVSPVAGEKTTGAVVLDAVKGAGAVGTLLNHSEARVRRKDLDPMLKELRHARLDVCLCAGNSTEAASLSRFGTKYLAVEPPELIGSGVAVSRARPEVVLKTVEATRRAGYMGKVLCGAGIVDGQDVAKAVELGADGVLVASSVLNAPNWGRKITELARSLD